MVVINDIMGRAARGEQVPVGVPLYDVIDNYPVFLLPVRDMREANMLWALTYNQMKGVESHGLQLVWPDREGNFPWDAGYAAEMRAVQPTFYRDPPKRQ